MDSAEVEDEPVAGCSVCGGGSVVDGSDGDGGSAAG